MNIQIFGTKKCNNTKKAERFFKERGIKFQFIDMKEKGMSKGEFNSVAQVNGGLENMINWEGKDKDLLALIKYIADEDKLEKVLENPQVIKTPVVRNGKQSTLGYQPDVWKGCEERAKDAPVMAVVTLVDSSGEELRVKAEDALLYKNNINEGDKVCYDKNDPDFVISQIEAKNSDCSVFRMN